MSRYIVMTTEHLKEMLDLAKQYKAIKVFDSDNNTDGESVWHCDVYFADDEESITNDAPSEVYSFNEAQEEGE